MNLVHSFFIADYADGGISQIIFRQKRKVKELRISGNFHHCTYVKPDIFMAQHMNEEFQFRELTSTIIGCAMTVHNFLGPGFTEIIYERSLLIELKRCGLQCISQVEKEIFFRNILVGKKRLDILVEGVVLLELKAISEMDKDCINKILNYLKVFGLEVGLLLNFGKPSLEFRRFAYSKSAKSF